MKFLMKLALGGMTPSGTAPHSHSSPIGNVLSGCLRVAEKLYNHLFYDRISWPLKKRVREPKAEWMPIIKATTHIENSDARYGLKGRSILCVGGRAKYYPVYHELVEAAGGHLFTFYGDSSDRIENLYELLEKTDMVICPVDCVNHQAYFTVKHYCMRSEKPCVLLDRSKLAVFQKGIRVLASMTAKPVKLINPSLTIETM